MYPSHFPWTRRGDCPRPPAGRCRLTHQRRRSSQPTLADSDPRYEKHLSLRPFEIEPQFPTAQAAHAAKRLCMVQKIVAARHDTEIATIPEQVRTRLACIQRMNLSVEPLPSNLGLPVAEQSTQLR